MGDIIGGVIGGIGSLFGGNSAKKNDLTGFNYLKNNAAVMSAQGAVPGALAGQDAALTGQQGVANNVNTLLTSNSSNNPAYQNYLNSTGYNFMLDTGSRAITGSAAARGLLNSGATGQALTQYGQNLGSQYFNNYLNQLNTNAAQYGQNAAGYGNRAALGVNAAESTGAAGTTGGVNAGAAQQSAISSGANQIGSAIGGLYNNYFGGI